MLIISKKAATEAECEAILDASLRESKPFDVLTVIFNPDDYKKPEGFWQSLFSPSLKTWIAKKTKDTFKDAGCESSSIRTTVISHALAVFNDVAQRKYCAAAHTRDGFNIVFIQRKQDIARFLVSAASRTPQDQLPQLPGHNTQHLFFNLWHEIGHGVAMTNEAAADAIAATVCRHAFEDCSFLKARADIRALYPVLAYSDYKKGKLVHGWGCVEAIDSIIAQNNPAPLEEIQALSKKFQRPADLYRQSVENIGRQLAGRAFPALVSGNLTHIAQAARKMVYDGVFLNETEYHIAQRFALAAKSLSLGAPAYAAPAKMTVSPC